MINDIEVGDKVVMEDGTTFDIISIAEGVSPSDLSLKKILITEYYDEKCNDYIVRAVNNEKIVEVIKDKYKIKSIMKEPEDIICDEFSVLKGEEVLTRFYNQGYWKENYIPDELEKKKWVPEEDKSYKVWWRYIYPADFCSETYDKMQYIEECDEGYKERLIERINSKVTATSIKDLIELGRRLKVNIEDNIDKDTE